MKYSYSKDINCDFQRTESKVRDVLAQVGFGILTEINIKDAFKNKLDIDYKNYKILGACNPALAFEALASEDLIGVLMPCNILIIDNENDTTKVVFPKAEELLEITDNKNIILLSEKVDKLLLEAFSLIN